MSVRTKITLWFAASLVIIVAVTGGIILFAEKSVMQKSIKDSLIETVENNVDEIEYYDSLQSILMDHDADRYLEYNGAYLEVDDDFLPQVNEVYTSLYTSEGELIYGYNPIAKITSDLACENYTIQTAKGEGGEWYVFDRTLTGSGLEGLWLRGVVSGSRGTSQITAVARISMLFLVVLLLVSLSGGALVVGRLLRPIEKISEAVSEIEQGSDLKKKIDIGEGKDELHRLARAFNEMIDRLDRAFDREKSFTSDVSHELRTPVSVISAQCEYILEEPRSAEEYVEAITAVKRQNRRMSRLINDMLAYTRIGLGSSRYGKEQLDFSELVNAVCEDLADLRDKNITLSWKTGEGICITGNRELLVRLLTNLIVNAYRYGKEDGHIRVTLEQKENHSVLSVEDDGIGIREEELGKIFDRFYQADPSRSSGGTGLGLSMAAEIAAFHSGSITVTSQIQEGSCFTFTMPKKN